MSSPNQTSNTAEAQQFPEFIPGINSDSDSDSFPLLFLGGRNSKFVLVNSVQLPKNLDSSYVVGPNNGAVPPHPDSAATGDAPAIRTATPLSTVTFANRAIPLSKPKSRVRGLSSVNWSKVSLIGPAPQPGQYLSGVIPSLIKDESFVESPRSEWSLLPPETLLPSSSYPNGFNWDSDVVCRSCRSFERILTVWDLAKIHYWGLFGEHIQFRLAGDNERSCTVADEAEGWVSFHKDYVSVGLKYPFPYFLIKFLNHFQIALTQLYPNAVHYIICFEALCRLKKVVPSVNLFCYFFTVSSKPSDYGYIQIQSRKTAPTLFTS